MRRFVLRLEAAEAWVGVVLALVLGVVVLEIIVLLV